MKGSDHSGNSLRNSQNCHIPAASCPPEHSCPVPGDQIPKPGKLRTEISVLSLCSGSASLGSWGWVTQEPPQGTLAPQSRAGPSVQDSRARSTREQQGGPRCSLTGSKPSPRQKSSRSNGGRMAGSKARLSTRSTDDSPGKSLTKRAQARLRLSARTCWAWFWPCAVFMDRGNQGRS